MDETRLRITAPLIIGHRLAQPGEIITLPAALAAALLATRPTAITEVGKPVPSIAPSLPANPPANPPANQPKRRGRP